MFRIHSPMIRILSPILSILIVLSPLLNVAAQDSRAIAVVTKDTEHTVVSGGASGSRGNSVTDRTAQSISQRAASGQSSIEEEMSGVQGRGKSAECSDSAVDSQDLSGDKHSSAYNPNILSKSGTMSASSEVVFEKAAGFSKSNSPAIMLLRVNMPEKSSGQLSEVGIELQSEDNEVIFESYLNGYRGRNLISISARDFDSLAQIDHSMLADSLAQFDQLLISNERTRELLLFDFRPPSGNLKLQYQNFGLDEIEYSFSLIPIESLESRDLLCDICQTAMSAATWLVLELACSLSPYGAAAVICIVSVKFPPLIPICLSSATFVIAWGDILGTIICELTGDARDEVSESITSWFCTITGSCSDTYPPVVFLQSPGAGDLYTGTLSIIATVAGEASSIDYVEFDYSSNGGSTWYDVVGPGHSNGITTFEGEGSILFNTETAGIDYSTLMKVRVRAADTEGNVSDWVESEGYFTLDNRTEDPSSITVTANLNPSTSAPSSPVQVTGSAHYDIGGPAYPATATISVAGIEWTAPIQANGSYSRSITSPNSEGTYSVSIAVSDGSISGSTNRQLVVDEGTQTSDCWVYGDALTCRDVDQNDDPVDITSYFRSDDMKVSTWVSLTDVYLDENCKSDPVQVKCEYYRPDGSLHYSPITHTIPDPGDGYYWEWYNTAAHYSVAGYDMSDIEGKWTIKVSVSSSGSYRLVKILSFTLRYDFGSHLMAEGVQSADPWDPINPKNNFCNTDVRALTWAQIYNVCEGLEVKWDFFEPTGDLYGAAIDTTDDPGVGYYDAWWKVWGWTNIFSAPAQSKTGDWRVDVSIKDAFGNWDLEYSDHFDIRECPGVNPTLSVSASPVSPLEGNPISLSVSASDNGYLENVTLHWNDGSARSQAWSDIKANSFSNSVSIGSFPTPISISYYATGEDADGNIGRSTTRTLIVQDTDTEGPSITALSIEESSGNGNGIIEDCENIHISFNVSDPSGVDSVALLVDSTDISLGGSYFATISPLDVGEHYITILALDADEPPAGTVLIDTITVQPCGSVPVLAWTGETGFVSDGVNADTGYAGSAFEYRVQYSDADGDEPATGYPVVYIQESGTNISGSPYLMVAVDSSSVDSGRVYTFDASGIPFDPYGLYSYRFEALDVHDDTASGAPSLTTMGPVIVIDSFTVWVDSANTTAPWDGTFANPYQTITAGIAAAENGDTVRVMTGTYYESIDFGGKELVVLGQDSTVAPTISGQSTGAIIGANSSLRRFNIIDADVGVRATGQSIVLSDLTIPSPDTGVVIDGAVELYNSIVSDAASIVVLLQDDFGSSVHHCGFWGGSLSFPTGPTGIGVRSTTNHRSDSCDAYHNVLPPFLAPLDQCLIDAGDTTIVRDPDGTYRDIGAGYFHHHLFIGKHLCGPHDRPIDDDTVYYSYAVNMHSDSIVLRKSMPEDYPEDAVFIMGWYTCSFDKMALAPGDTVYISFDAGPADWRCYPEVGSVQYGDWPVWEELDVTTKQYVTEIVNTVGPNPPCNPQLEVYRDKARTIPLAVGDTLFPLAEDSMFYPLTPFYCDEPFIGECRAYYLYYYSIDGGASWSDAFFYDGDYGGSSTDWATIPTPNVITDSFVVKSLTYDWYDQEAEVTLGYFHIRGDNYTPVLVWTGEPGFESDGVTPDTGNPSTAFTFAVTYIDTGGTAPADSFPRLHVRADGTPVAGSPFAMSSTDPTPVDSGRVYTVTLDPDSLQWNPLVTYTYQFEAADEDTLYAIGEASAEMPGPVILEPSGIIWVDANNVAGPWLGTEVSPYLTIADGIAAAENGDTVMVMTATYDEAIDFSGKELVVLGQDSTTAPTVSGQATGVILGDNSTLRRFNISASSVGISGTGSGIVVSDCSVAGGDTGVLINGAVDFYNCLVTGSGAYSMYFESDLGSSVHHNGFWGDSIAFYGGPVGLGERVAVNLRSDSCDVFFNQVFEFDYGWESPKRDFFIDAGDTTLQRDPDGTFRDIGAGYVYHALYLQRHMLGPVDKPANEELLQQVFVVNMHWDTVTFRMQAWDIDYIYFSEPYSGVIGPGDTVWFTLTTSLLYGCYPGVGGAYLGNYELWDFLHSDGDQLVQTFGDIVSPVPPCNTQLILYSVKDPSHKLFPGDTLYPSLGDSALLCYPSIECDTPFIAECRADHDYYYSTDGGQSWSDAYSGGWVGYTLTMDMPMVNTDSFLVRLEGYDWYQEDIDDTVGFFYIRGVPELDISPTSLSFAVTTTSPVSDPQILTIGADSDSLPFGISFDSAWLSTSIDTGATEEPIDVTVDATGLTEGLYIDTIEITSDLAGNSPQYVVCSLNVDTGSICQEEPICFEFVNNTGETYPLLIDSIIVSGLPIGLCTEIAVFDDTLCVGATVFEGEWPVGVAAWADDPQTPEKDGYTEGNEITFRVANPDFCDTVEVCPNGLGWAMGDGTFGSGFAGQVGLTDSTCCRWFYRELYEGWNLVSLNTAPDSLELPGFLSSVWDDINIIKQADGAFTMPGSWIGIDRWRIAEAYKIHMKTTRTVEFCGSPVEVPTLLPLPAGWSWVSYFPMLCMPPDVALVSLECLNIVKDIYGGFYIPGTPPFMGDMCPGEGYAVHLACEDTLIYPEGSGLPVAKSSGASSGAASATSHFEVPKATSDFHAIVVVGLDVLTEGDEVAIVDESGHVLGASIVSGNATPISVWYDDEQTEEIDGYQSGTKTILKIWKQDQNREIRVVPELVDGSLEFGQSPYTILSIDQGSLVPDEFSLSVNYPNPFNPTTTIEFSLPNPDEIELSVFNVLGQKVITLYSGAIEAGNHTITWDATNGEGSRVSSGIYFYRLTSRQGTDAKKMVLLK